MNYARATGQQIVGRGGANDAKQSVGWGPAIMSALPWGGLPWSWRGGTWPYGGWDWSAAWPCGDSPYWGGYGPFGYLSPYGIVVAGDKPGAPSRAAAGAANQSVGYGPVMARSWGWDVGPGGRWGYPWTRSPAGYWPYSYPWGYAPDYFEPSGFVPWELTAGAPSAAATGWAPPAWALPALGGAVFGAVAENWLHRRAQSARRPAPSAAGARAMWGYGAGQAPPPPRPAPPGLDRRRPPPPRMNTWERWQRVHPGTPYSDYRNWWSQYGQQGATISGDQFHGAGYGTGARAMWGYGAGQAPPPPRPAPQPPAHKCCDANGNYRCWVNPSPPGSDCFCYGQGWGWACY